MSDRSDDSDDSKKPEIVKDVSTDRTGGLEEGMQQNVDLTKFILGLATAVLIFSVTFIDKLVPQMVHKWLLAIGWLGLLCSMLVGVALISLSFRLRSGVKDVQNLLAWLVQDPLTKMFEGIAEDVVPSDKPEAKRKVAEFLSKKEAWLLIQKGGISLKRDSEFSEVDRSFAKLMYDVIFVLEKVIGKTDTEKATFAIKQLRASWWRLLVVKTMGSILLGSFYAGVFAIALFGFLDFVVE